MFLLKPIWARKVSDNGIKTAIQNIYAILCVNIHSEESEHSVILQTKSYLGHFKNTQNFYNDKADYNSVTIRA